MDLERRVELRSGEVQGSFFAAADAADIPDSIAQEIIDALESEIDFHRNLRRGDSFRAIYEGLYAGGEYLRPGRLLAVEFINQGKAVEAFWFDDGSKHGGYYAYGGRSMKRAFLRSPLEYTRMSSGFSDSRTHPVFGYDAAHRGIDYSAPTGTKVRTVAGGHRRVRRLAARLRQRGRDPARREARHPLCASAGLRARDGQGGAHCAG